MVELLVAEVDVVGWGVIDVVVDKGMELVVGVMAFVYDPYRMMMVVQYCKTYTGRADGETGFTDRTNGTVREDIYGS